MAIYGGVPALKAVKGVCSSSQEPISELQSVTCHMGLRSVTCHPTQVNVPRLNGSQPGRQVLNLPTLEGWKAELTMWLVYIPRWFTCPQTVTHPSSNHLMVTRPGVVQVRCPTIKPPSHGMFN